MRTSTTPDATDTISKPTACVWQPRIHVPEIDGIRGLAILMVTLYRFGKTIPADSSLGYFLSECFAVGERGVDLFFVLSGFLITGILFDARHDPHYFRNFFVRRGLRIFPLYFVSLILLLSVLPLANWSHFPFQEAMQRKFALWTYLTNIEMSWEGAWCFGPLDHYWSLAVEEHFYFVWPFVIFAVTRTQGLRLAVALAMASCLSRLAWAACSHNEVAPDVFTWFRADGLLLGAALALALRGPDRLQAARPWLVYAIPLSFIMPLALTLGHRRLWTVGNTLWPLAWSTVLIWVLTASPRAWIACCFRSAFLRNLGKYSYAMYIVQNPLIPLIGLAPLAWLTDRLGSPIGGHLAYVAAMFSITYLLALTSWHLLEKHCLRWKDYFAPGHGARMATPARSAVQAG